MKSHAEMYPDQYSHPLCGKRVKITVADKVGTVSRVVNSRFGMLVVLNDNDKEAWSIRDCHVLDSR